MVVILCLCDICLFMLHYDTCVCINVAMLITFNVNEIDEYHCHKIMT